MNRERVALVSGAIGGIGTAIVKQLVKDGYNVVATFRPESKDVAQNGT